MSIERIERTSIWKNTLAIRPNDEFQIEREKLRSAFLSFRNNTAYLVSKIATALPELTQHEITHLDALWETANLIIGDNFQLTPLEGFVIGGAFLLHDSALCFEAYESGKEGLRRTIQWKDAYADLKDSNPFKSIHEIEHEADFIAIRNLHAYQAEKLLNTKWVDSSTQNELYLLDNQELRNHLGKLIGQIASSHHWDIEKVTSTFNAQQNVPTGFPIEWRIDPIKLACILRCADATHIDNERAPDFLHALLKRSGVSFDHWKAQNRLAKVDIDQTDTNKATLLFTSTIDFKEEDSDAWFVAYDAICLVDKEIKSCNSILEKHGGINFKAKRVKGVESPESMSYYIKASGWKPCAAKVHVGNVEKIIHNLGGEMLYGSGSDILGIVLRELIQNSRDAIVARSNYDNEFQGKVTVRIDKDSSSTWLTIEDNGIGMSERILTGPLLDFGTSFWTSSLVQSEFPGLRSSKFKSIGKFGIGFYSIFMLADQVFVASRNWNAGFSDINQLKFNKGFSLKPILSKEVPLGFGSSISTQIKLKLKPNNIPDNLLIEIKTNKMGVTSFNVPFKNYLASLCSGLDVKVFYKESNGSEVKVHESIYSKEFNKLQWLTDISFADFQPDSLNVKDYISKNINRLEPIIENEKILGLAAISTKVEQKSQDFLSIETIGGLAASAHHRDGDNFIGFLDYVPKSAKRERHHLTASDKVIKDWAAEQMQQLLSLSLTPIEKYFSSSALCHFNADPTPIAQIMTVYNNKTAFLSIPELAELSTKMEIAFLNSGLGGGHMETYHHIHALNGYALIRPLAHGTFLSLKLENGKPENNNSILDCIYRGILTKGYTPVLTEKNNIGVNLFNQRLSLIVLSSKK